MKLIIMLLIATLACSCFAENKTKNIQVSATILPYCRIIVEQQKIYVMDMRKQILFHQP